MIAAVIAKDMNNTVVIDNNIADIAKKAADILKSDGVVIFPTDTVYGIGALRDNKTAVEKIYALKGRDFKKPLALLVADTEIVYNLSDNVPDEAKRLMEKFWPGALTVVLTNTDGSTLGFRMPNDNNALKIIKEAGSYIATTSVNKSGEADAVDFKEIDANILKGTDFAINGGKCALKVSSSVIMFDKENQYKILREGAVTKAMIEETLLNG